MSIRGDTLSGETLRGDEPDVAGAVPVTDVHTHFFNVLHLPIEGIIVKKTKMSQPASAEFSDILKRAALSGRPLFDPLRLPTDADGSVDTSMNGLPMPPGYEEMKSISAQPATLESDVGEAQAILGPADDFYHILQIPRAALKWLFQMTLPPNEQIRYYRSRIVGAARVVCHLMDLDGFYEGTAYLDVGKRHDDLKSVLKGNANVIGFAAYNPHHEDPVGILEQLHRDLQGHMGVKFYPPAGYRPIGNGPETVPRSLDPTRVDQLNLQLFKWCVEAGVPVFSHCTGSGFATEKEYGDNAHPDCWRQLFEEHKNLADLHLCLGHAGGADQWINGSLGRFARSTLELAQDFKNVFIEFGHFEEITWSNSKKKGFVKSLGRAHEDFPFAISKAMFGTDWHVSNAVVLENDYVDNHFADAVGRVKGIDMDRFFNDAATEYLAPIL